MPKCPNEDCDFEFGSESELDVEITDLRCDEYRVDHEAIEADVCGEVTLYCPECGNDVVTKYGDAIVHLRLEE